MNVCMANQQVSDSRKLLYYGGMVVTGLGVLIFVSIFFRSHEDVFADVEGAQRSMVVRGICGMALLVAGGFMRSVGAKGLAGSGVVLDPEKARRDVEPWSRAGGGMLRDALDETGLDIGRKTDESGDFDDKLRKLHQLRQDGILTEEEYQKEKSDILDEL